MRARLFRAYVAAFSRLSSFCSSDMAAAFVLLQLYAYVCTVGTRDCSTAADSAVEGRDGPVALFIASS